MDKAQNTVYVDEEIEPRILAVIREAQKYVGIVTPYVELWQHAQNALASAVQRGVEVWAIVRDDPQVLGGEGVTWFLNNGVKVLAAKNLHAKIYLNESIVLISSMNLTAFSTNNSSEIALAVLEPRVQQQIRQYLTERLVNGAKSVSSARAERVPQVAKPQRGVSRRRQVMGHCIRCSDTVLPDIEKPLCGDCYDIWAEYQNQDYLEDYCFVCGEASRGITYAKPLCASCYRSVTA